MADETGTPTLAQAVKAGPRTSEFYFSISASLLSGSFAVGLVTVGDGEWSKLAGLAAFMLTTMGYQVSRGLAKFGVTALVLLCAFAIATSGPACSSAARRDAITAAVIASDAAGSALDAYVPAREGEIIGSASTLADGQAKLAAFRVSSHAVAAAIAAVYRAAAIAALANDDPSVASMLAAAKIVVTEISALKAGTP